MQTNENPKRNGYRILDLDAGLLPQQSRFDTAANAILPLQEWGRKIRIGCSFKRFQEFAQQLPETGPTTFFGSGDFHHVSLGFTQQIREPFNLIILDKHPDWVQGIPLMHCGTWVAHALKNLHLIKLYHFGGDLDFDNGYRHLAPWPELRSGRVIVYPATRRYTVGRWKMIPHEPLRTEAKLPFDLDRLQGLIAAEATELAARPTYLSIDKDVMIAADAVVNWDSGQLTLAEVCTLTRELRRITPAFKGCDIVGDWSPFRARGILRPFLDKWEHPKLSISEQQAAKTNAACNQELLRAIS